MLVHELFGNNMIRSTDNHMRQSSSSQANKIRSSLLTIPTVNEDFDSKKSLRSTVSDADQ